jgi:hypothetical protein
MCGCFFRTGIPLLCTEYSETSVYSSATSVVKTNYVALCIYVVQKKQSMPPQKHAALPQAAKVFSKGILFIQ